MSLVRACCIKMQSAFAAVVLLQIRIVLFAQALPMRPPDPRNFPTSTLASVKCFSGVSDVIDVICLTSSGSFSLHDRHARLQVCCAVGGAYPTFAVQIWLGAAIVVLTT